MPVTHYRSTDITGTPVGAVPRLMTKHLAVLVVALIVLVVVPGFSLWLPTRLGL